MATTATTDAVERKVVDTLAQFGPDPSEITREAEFEALDIDSLDLVELGQVVDEEFGVKIDGDDLPQLRTVGDAIDLIVARAS